MEDIGKTFSLKLEGTINGERISPASIPLGLLNEFNQQAGKFLKGSHTKIDLDKLQVRIEEGSYRLVPLQLALAVGLAADLSLLANGNLDDMDPKRAEIVEEWQRGARKSLDVRYVIGDAAPIIIDRNSSYQRHENAVWLSVEKYLHGMVSDLGGVKPNLHLRLASGQLLSISLREEQVLQKEQNLVYRPVLLRVRAEEELSTGKLRHAKLLDFVDYQPAFDEAAFDAMTEKGAKAWADVPDASRWVEDFRGAA